jgi:4-alpha-glucanotransferase
MTLGLMPDLAVGVHPGGSDTWGWHDVYADGMNVGAPPDAYNQNGQDWGQRPWRPDRLAAVGYQPYVTLVRAVLRHAGAVRIDHIIGLFRLWWVPLGGGPGEGTYVRYDHEAMVGILALEARRAGAVVVGEDLGTVEPSARSYLAERGVLGTSLLWFENGAEGRPLPPQQWRPRSLASVTTHDLPPTAAYLAGEHVRLRDRLELLTRPYEEELAADQAARTAWLQALVDAGTLDAADARLADDTGDGVDKGLVHRQLLALHRYLRLTPARLINVLLTDAVGDRRSQNLPGTVDEYPNWRVPLCDPDGRPITLEQVMDDPAVVEVIAAATGGAAGG